MVIYGFCGMYRLILGYLHIYIYTYGFIGLIGLYRVILLGPSLQFVSHLRVYIDVYMCVDACNTVFQFQPS